jgi:hypothetical protein
MQYAMLVQIWLGALNTMIYGWGFVKASHQRKRDRHNSKAPELTSAVAANGESTEKDS